MQFINIGNKIAGGRIATIIRQAMWKSKIRTIPILDSVIQGIAIMNKILAISMCRVQFIVAKATML